MLTMDPWLYSISVVNETVKFSGQIYIVTDNRQCAAHIFVIVCK